MFLFIEGPPRKAQKLQETQENVQKPAKTVSADSSSQSLSSSTSSDATSSSQSSSGSSSTSNASADSSSRSESTNSESHSATSSSRSSDASTTSQSARSSSSSTCSSRRVSSADGETVPSGSHITEPSPTPGTTAISVRQTSAGTTSDGLIRFAESASSSGKPSSADASLRSDRLAERSSLADRSNARMHPYRPLRKTDKRRQESQYNFSFKKYEMYRNVEDLLECHSTHLYRLRKHSKWHVNSRALVEAVRRNEKPAFSSYKFVRATRSAAQKILGETNVVDDLEDVPFTADDIKHFDEKKRMAEELDRAFGSYADDDGRK